MRDTVHTTRQTERAHRLTGARWPRILHTQHNTLTGHTGEQEPRGPGHRKHNTTHRAHAPVSKSKEAEDTAHATQYTERARR